MLLGGVLHVQESDYHDYFISGQEIFKEWRIYMLRL